MPRMKGPLTASIFAALTRPIRNSRSRDNTSIASAWRPTITLLPIRSGLCHQLEKYAKTRAASARTPGLAKNDALAGGVAISLTCAIVMGPQTNSHHHGLGRQQRVPPQSRETLL